MWTWVFAVAGLASMRASIDGGDVDEAARQGMLAGPKVIEQALAAPDRPAKLAGIAAAPSAVDREELLQPLFRVASSGDRRIAIPAAISARTIARDMSRTELPDDVAHEDVVAWGTHWAALARDRDRFIEIRTIALDVAIALDPAIGLAPLLADPDPAVRRAAIAVIPAPVPGPLRMPLAALVIKDTDNSVALAAAASLCADLAQDPPPAILDALGTAGLDRIKSLVISGVNSGAKPLVHDASRCLRR